MSERDFMIMSKRFIFGATYEQLSNEFGIKNSQLISIIEINKEKFYNLLKGAINEQ